MNKIFIIRNLKDNKSIKNYAITILYKLLCVALSFLNSILINRCLGVALRGEYTTIITVASLLQLVANIGIGSAYPALKRRYNDKCKYIFFTYTIILSIVYFLLLLPILFLGSVNSIFIAILTFVTTVENILIFIAIVEDVKKRNTINIWTSIIHTLVLSIIYIFYDKDLKLVLSAVILDHIVLCAAFIKVYKLRMFKKEYLTALMTREILSIGFPAMLMNMLMYMNYHADVLFLSYLQNDATIIGLYGTGITLGNMLWIIPDAFKDILYNRSAQEDNPNEVIIAIIVNMALCLIIVLGFVFFGKWFLSTMYGDEFLDAYGITLLIFVGTFPMILYKLIHPIYIANRKTKTVVYLLSIAVVINIVLNLILIPQYNAYGAAVASIVSYSVCGIAFYVKFKNDFEIKKTEIISKIITIFK